MAEVFIVASVDLVVGGRRSSTAAISKALRRVGADVAVLFNCEHGSAVRIKKEARYADLSSAGGEPAVAVLSGGKITRQDPREGLLLCETKLNGAKTSIAAVRKRPLEVCTIAVRLSQVERVVICGEYDQNLNDPMVLMNLREENFLDTRDIQGGSESRQEGIIVKGISTHGSGEYTSEDGVTVIWARLGR